MKLFQLFFTLIILSGMMGCAEMGQLDHLSASDFRKQDPQMNQALTFASYYFQRKYDLLEEGLLKEFKKSKAGNLLIGQLFSAVDLADFYTYGFINYQKSLEYYDEAEALNQRIERVAHIQDYTEKTPVNYFKASGRYAMPRQYDYKNIAEQIASGRKKIYRIYRHQAGQGEAESELPDITSLVTENYAYAIQIERYLLDTINFDRFKDKLSMETQTYFKRRYKLSEAERRYYINFNILRGLTRVFELSALPESKVKGVYALLEEVRNEQSGIGDELQNAYLDFVEVLCLTALGSYDSAISVFERFQFKIDKINTDLDAYLNYLKTAQKKAFTKATVKTIGFMALAVVTMGQAQASGGGFYFDMTSAGVLDFAGSVSSFSRQLEFTGESEYSKNWNILLNIDDQLQFFRAAGKAYHNMGLLEKSVEFNKEAVTIIANLRSTITTEMGRVSFAGYRDEIYSYLIEDLFFLGDHEQAFYYAENSRARSLVDLLGSQNVVSFGSQDLNSYAKQLKEIQIYKDRLKQNVGISDHQIQYLNELEKKLNSKYLQQKSRGLMVSVNKESSGPTEKMGENYQNVSPEDPYLELRDLITVNNLNFRQTQRLLPENSTLVEYHVGEKGIYVWIIEKENFIAKCLKVDRNDSAKAVKRFLQLINSRDKTKENEMIVLAGEIYAQLFLPIEKNIENKLIYIVSHEFLHSLPFEALRRGEQFLVDHYCFSYLPNASVMQFLESLGPAKNELLVLGNPQIPEKLNLSDLPGAEKEALRISSFFSDKTVLTHQNASETNFKLESPVHSITHFAGHGIFDEQNAMNSTLFLSPDERNDGELKAYEIYDIPGMSKLVVLSACETARAKIGNGDELLGLMRGFFFSGASTLVASMWSVDDIGTLALMEKFYTYMINDNMFPALALQAAKKDMIASDLFNTPFYWAPFNLYGLGT